MQRIILNYPIDKYLEVSVLAACLYSVSFRGQSLEPLFTQAYAQDGLLWLSWVDETDPRGIYGQLLAISPTAEAVRDQWHVLTARWNRRAAKPDDLRRQLEAVPAYPQLHQPSLIDIAMVQRSLEQSALVVAYDTKTGHCQVLRISP